MALKIGNKAPYFESINQNGDKVKLSDFIGKKVVLYFHNDPLTMTGSRSLSDRKALLNNATKIIFNSHWSRKRFLEGIKGFHINSEKMNVIYQSTSLVNVNIHKLVRSKICLG